MGSLSFGAPGREGRDAPLRECGPEESLFILKPSGFWISADISNKSSDCLGKHLLWPQGHSIKGLRWSRELNLDLGKNSLQLSADRFPAGMLGGKETPKSSSLSLGNQLPPARFWVHNEIRESPIRTLNLSVSHCNPVFLLFLNIFSLF